jgi:hypothetical protein
MKSGNRSKLRGWILNIHLYGGLLSCWYLLLFGISSLGFNHPGLVSESKGAVLRRQVSMEVPQIDDDLKLAEFARDRLGLIGWPLPWNMERDSTGNLRFEMSRPGKSYQIYLDRAAGVARIEAQSTGYRSILHFLHGSTEGIPGSNYMTFWSLYTEFTTWFVLFALFSGIWLWAKRDQGGKTVLAALLISVAVSLAFMAYLTYQG